MDYKIIRATAKIGQIEVAYIDGGKTIGVYAIDVPVVDGAFIVGEPLESLIQKQAPVWVSQREQDVVSATGFEQIEALVEAAPANQMSQEDIANIEMWEQHAYESKLAKALVKFGVLQSDPTTIEVTKL